MTKFLKLLLPILMVAEPAFAAGRIQNEDVKSQADIQASVLTTTGTVTSGSACISSIGSATGLSVGQYAYDSTHAYIPSGTTIAGLPGTCATGQVQLSANATGTGSGDTLTFGGTASQLINDTKIWSTGVTPNQTLFSAISTGAIGGTGGSKNYLTTYKGNTGNGNFEFGNTNGWSLGTIGTLTNGLPTGTPTFGSGASGNLSISAATTSPLAGTYSLSYASSAATTVGNAVCSSAFSIDAEDQAKVLTLKAYFQAFSGASNMNFSGSSSNSYGLAVYDVTNSSWLTLQGAFSMTQSSGTGYAVATTQTNATTASARVCIYNVSATAGAATLYLDDISYGPQTAPSGPALGDFVDESSLFSLTGVGTPTSVKFFDRRVGDSLEVFGTYVSGTPTSVAFSINLPTKYVINASKMTTSVNSQIVGEITFGGTSTAAFTAATSGVQQIFYDGSTTGSLFVAYQYGGGQLVKNLANALYSSGQMGTVHFTVPIAGWSSNTVQSNDTDTRVIAASATGSFTSTASGTFTAVVFTSTSFDSAGAMGTSTYTVPVSGYYSISGILKWPSYSVGYNAAAINQNGTQSNLVSYAYNGGTASTGNIVSGVLKCNAGDTISLTAYQGSGGSVSLAGATLSINRLSGPAVVQATESVNGRYFSSSSSISGTDATITYSTKDFDSHGAYNGGTLTIPVSGKYQFNAKLVTTASSAFGTHVAIYKNGVLISDTYSGGASQIAGINNDASMSDTISCLAGDLITVRGSNSGSSPSIYSSNGRNSFSWARVGN